MKENFDTDKMYEAAAEKIKEQKGGEMRTIGSKEVGLSPEEKQQQEEELRARMDAYTKKKAHEAIIKTFKTPLMQIMTELNKGKTLDDIFKEINEKKSNLSRSTRDFCTNFKPEAILGLIEEIKNPTKAIDILVGKDKK